MKVDNPGMEFSSAGAEELARQCADTLRVMKDILETGSSHQSVTLELADGHAWRVSRAFGLVSAVFVCPGGEGDHIPACEDPDPMTDDGIAFLDGRLPGQS